MTNSLLVLNKIFKQRFEELEEQLSQIKASKFRQSYGGSEYVNDELLLGWKVKVRNLLSKVCGEGSQHVGWAMPTIFSLLTITILAELKSLNS